ncbi:gametocyte-specific factor 1-like [Pituophis catenifer annectens]|uniref:gametocyte-specific factor 1-like n=1 Tax=Pituophis catenifer annectens TaxID=94852 RepID=UPI0039956491
MERVEVGCLPILAWKLSLLYTSNKLTVCGGISWKAGSHRAQPPSTSLMDPERLVQCPYDKNHQIRASRFPYHLVKCKENNEKIAKKLATCPYNARHRIPKEEFNFHLENCENKIALDVSNGASNLNMGIKEVTGAQCPPSQEDWEADADKCPAPLFVFGKSYSEQKK